MSKRVPRIRSYPPREDDEVIKPYPGNVPSDDSSFVWKSGKKAVGPDSKPKWPKREVDDSWEMIFWSGFTAVLTFGSALLIWDSGMKGGYCGRTCGSAGGAVIGFCVVGAFALWLFLRAVWTKLCKALSDPS